MHYNIHVNHYGGINIRGKLMSISAVKEGHCIRERIHAFNGAYMYMLDQAKVWMKEAHTETNIQFL